MEPAASPGRSAMWLTVAIVRLGQRCCHAPTGDSPRQGRNRYHDETRRFGRKATKAWVDVLYAPSSVYPETRGAGVREQWQVRSGRRQHDEDVHVARRGGNGHLLRTFKVPDGRVAGRVDRGNPGAGGNAGEATSL